MIDEDNGSPGNFPALLYTHLAQVVRSFSGPVGYAIVSRTSALLVTVTLYTLQARHQVSNDWHVIGVFRSSSSYWQRAMIDFVNKAPGRIGVDARLVSYGFVENIKSLLNGQESTLYFPPQNLVDLVWTDRPSRSRDPIYLGPILSSTGRRAGPKLSNLRGWLKIVTERGTERGDSDISPAVIISDLPSVGKCSDRTIR